MSSATLGGSSILVSSIYHCHIEYFFAFLLEIMFLVWSVNRPADSSSCPWLGWVSFPLGFLCLMTERDAS